MGQAETRGCRVVHDDCMQGMAALPADSIDAVVTDPPYGIGFMGKDWDGDGVAFPGEEDGGPRSFQAWTTRWGRQALRIMRPGAHLLAFGGTRTSHRLVCGLEDAGFEVRDSIDWAYGSGMPKNTNVRRSIDEHLCVLPGRHYWNKQALPEGDKARPNDHVCPETEAGRRHAYLGTGLKPAHEPIAVLRKPFAANLAANILQHGTAAINIVASRIGPLERWPTNKIMTHAADCRRIGQHVIQGGGFNGIDPEERTWGPEVVDTYECAPSCPVQLIDAQAGPLRSGGTPPPNRPEKGLVAYGRYGGMENPDGIGASQGSASRFFPTFEWSLDDVEWLPFYYAAKASRTEREAGLDNLPARTARETVGRDPNAAGVRNPRAGAGRGAGVVRYRCARCGRNVDGGRRVLACTGGQPHEPVAEERGDPIRNHHPTVKPLALMEWLVRLATPIGGTVLDPFAGTGTTGCAAVRQGFKFLGFEQDADYHRIAQARLDYHAQPFDAKGQPRPERRLADFLQET